ncbi:MAG: hypothetical protein E7355_03870 [Clostridiales bacterium]|nr:hypothetical protein [Clostridiales bacterium]
MRKITKWLVTFFATALFAMSFMGCFGARGGDSSSDLREKTLTVYNGETASTYTVMVNSMAEIDAPTKKGYYLEGIYDQEMGGTKYFDCLGKALVKWEKSFPTTLYARWMDISTLSQEATVFGNEPTEFGVSTGRKKVTLNKEFVSALKGNFDNNLKIQYSVEMKAGQGFGVEEFEVYVKGYDNDGADRHYICKETAPEGSFAKFTGTVEVESNDFTEGNIYITAAKTTSAVYPVMYIRNLTITVTFA